MTFYRLTNEHMYAQGFEEGWGGQKTKQKTTVRRGLPGIHEGLGLNKKQAGYGAGEMAQWAELLESIPETT